MDRRTLLFDLDGTLTDSRPGIVNCIRHALDRLGVACPPESGLAAFIGPPLAETFAKLLGEHHASPAVERAVTIYRERFSTIGIFENALYPGVGNLLATLVKDNYAVLLATSKPQVYAARIIDYFRLGHYFQAVHGSELGGERADKAALIHFLIDRYSLNTATTVMIGDRRHDVLGAAANGIECIGVTYGYGSPGELREAGAAALADTPQAIGVMLAAHFSAKHR